MTQPASSRPTADPTSVVADADVLAADLLCGREARAAMDLIREHSWMTLVASDHLLEEAQALIESLADNSLATDWRKCVESKCQRVEHVNDDHPGLASAAAGEAAHLLTLDEDLIGPRANISVQSSLRVSIRTPIAFIAIFDAAALYEAKYDRAYPGPDHDPRG